MLRAPHRHLPRASPRCAAPAVGGHRRGRSSRATSPPARPRTSARRSRSAAPTSRQVSTVDVLFDGVLMGSAPTGSIGEFEIQLPAPFTASRASASSSLTVRDAVNRRSRRPRAVTNLAMTVKPTPRARRGTRVRFRGRGFTRRPRRSTRTTSSAARSRRRSGSARPRRRLRHVHASAPADPVRERRAPGRWTMQVDQKRAVRRRSRTRCGSGVRSTCVETSSSPRRAPAALDARRA